MILCPLSMKLQKPNAFLLYKTCMFEVYLPFKNNFILSLGNKINQFLTQTNCSVQDFPRTTFYQFAFFFFFIYFQKVIVNEVISFLKQWLQLASIHGIFSCIQHLNIQAEATKKFSFHLLCLYYLYYIPYDIQLTICFQKSRKVKALFSIMKNLNQY